MQRARFLVAIVLILFLVSSLLAQDEVGFVEAEVDNLTPYIGEPIAYTVRVFDAGTTTGKQYEPPTFASFGQIEGEESTEIATLNGRQYTIISQNTVLIPLVAGSLTIEPATIIVPETALQSGATLTSEAIAIEVLPLPPDSSGTFSRAIGQFTMDLVSQTSEYRVGEPFTLQLIVEGSGNLEQSISPELPLPENWRFFSNPPVFELISATTSRRIFEWVVIPSTAGEQRIAPIVFTYFDPQIDNYRSISSTSLELSVLEGNVAFDTVGVPESTVQLSDAPLPLRPMIATVGRNPNNLGMLYWLLWGIPPILLVLTWAISRKRVDGVIAQKGNTKTKKIQSVAKGSNALKQLQKGLRVALKETNAATTFELTFAAIFNYFSQKFREDVTTKQDIIDILTDYPPKLQEQVLNCIETAESGRYAPVSVRDAKVLINRTMQVLSLIDKRAK